MGIRREGGSGQPCLWWSQGCSIGCDYCITDPRHEANGGKIPTRPVTGGWPHDDKAGFRTAYCDEPGQSVLPKKFWTLNLQAVEGAVNDSYRYNPWRAPGSAPVVDPCGQAGGKYPQTPMGGDSYFFTTNMSTMGDLGSKLPPTAGNLPQWVAGTDVQVAWGMRFNHVRRPALACLDPIDPASGAAARTQTVTATATAADAPCPCPARPFAGRRVPISDLSGRL